MQLMMIDGFVKAYFFFVNIKEHNIAKIPVCKIRKDHGSVPAKARGTKKIRIISNIYESFFIKYFNENINF
jgi:hypothetical protein